MNVLYLDCISGISGDMTVAALVDAGASVSHVEKGLAALPLSGYAIAWRTEDKNGIMARRFCVQLDADAAHEHRTLRDIAHSIDSASLSPFVKEKPCPSFD